MHFSLLIDVSSCILSTEALQSLIGIEPTEDLVQTVNRTSDRESRWRCWTKERQQTEPLGRTDPAFAALPIQDFATGLARACTADPGLECYVEIALWEGGWGDGVLISAERLAVLAAHRIDLVVIDCGRDMLSGD